MVSICIVSLCSAGRSPPPPPPPPAPPTGFPMNSRAQKGLAKIMSQVRFDLGEPFLPFEQLLGCLPGASAGFLPAPYARLMTSPESPIIDFYPEDFEVRGRRLACRPRPWEPQYWTMSTYSMSVRFILYTICFELCTLDTCSFSLFLVSFFFLRHFRPLHPVQNCFWRGVCQKKRTSSLNVKVLALSERKQWGNSRESVLFSCVCV